MKWISTGLVTVFALAATTVSAMPIIDISLSAGLNHSRVDGFVAAPAPNTLPESFTGTEPRVTFNASMTSLIGIELGWSKFGSDSSTLTAPPPPIVGGQPFIVDVKQSGSAMWFAYAPSLALGPIEMTGKVGVARVKQDLSFDSSGLDNNETEVLYGVAGTYWFGDALGFRVDAERIGSDVAQIGLSLTIGF